MSEMQTFETGATRSDDSTKNDYEGFLSPGVLRAYGDYMNENRVQADGNLRDSDNWQKGIPQHKYMKSFIRHALDLWLMWRGWTVAPEVRNGVPIPWTYKRLSCAVLFNVMGFLNELLREEEAKQVLHQSMVERVRADSRRAMDAMRRVDDELEYGGGRPACRP